MIVWVKCGWTKVRLKHLAWRMENSKHSTSLLTQTFQICQENLVAKQFDLSYKALDLIQLAYGEGIARPNESACLSGLAIQAMRQNAPEVASLVLYAYRPLLLQNSTQALAGFKHFLLLIPLLQKTGNYSLVNTLGELIFRYYSTVPELPPQLIESSWMVVRRIGRIAIRKRREPWLRDLLCQVFQFLTEYYTKANRSDLIESLLCELWLSWLHEAIQTRQIDVAKLLFSHLESWVQAGWLREATLAAACSELGTLLGIALLQRQTELYHQAIESCFSLAIQKYWLQFLKRVCQVVVQLSCLILEQQQSEQLFLLMHPLFNMGRRLLYRELRWGQGAGGDEFRCKALRQILVNSLEVADYWLKKDFKLTLPDVIIGWSGAWLAQGLPYGQTAKLFFRFLFDYWYQTRPQQAKRYGVSLKDSDPIWLKATGSAEAELIKKLPAFA